MPPRSGDHHPSRGVIKEQAERSNGAQMESGGRSSRRLPHEQVSLSLLLLPDYALFYPIVYPHV
jgi:hypothetical protein